MSIFSSNTPFTSGQLSTYFPTTNTATTMATIKFATQLLADGMIDDGQFAQIAALAGIYLDTIAEAYTVTSAVYTGTAGSTTRKYLLVPNYPLPTKINNDMPWPPFQCMPNPPPQGFPLPNANPALANQATPGNTYGGRRRLFGKMGASTTVSSTLATLSAAAYVTVVAPAASADNAGVHFDLLVQDGGTGDFNLIAGAVLPSATVVDTGLTRYPYAMYPNTTQTARYRHTELGVDTTGTHFIVYGPHVFLNPGFVAT